MPRHGGEISCDLIQLSVLTVQMLQLDDRSGLTLSGKHELFQIQEDNGGCARATSLGDFSFFSFFFPFLSFRVSRRGKEKKSCDMLRHRNDILFDLHCFFNYKFYLFTQFKSKLACVRVHMCEFDEQQNITTKSLIRFIPYLRFKIFKSEYIILKMNSIFI